MYKVISWVLVNFLMVNVLMAQNSDFDKLSMSQKKHFDEAVKKALRGKKEDLEIIKAYGKTGT